ncbi:hypothetical protein BKA80DRAFT_269358 [Phyllosticta citrichinensis]
MFCCRVDHIYALTCDPPWPAWIFQLEHSNHCIPRMPHRPLVYTEKTRAGHETAEALQRSFAPPHLKWSSREAALWIGKPFLAWTHGNDGKDKYLGESCRQLESNGSILRLLDFLLRRWRAAFHIQCSKQPLHSSFPATLTPHEIPLRPCSFCAWLAAPRTSYELAAMCAVLTVTEMQIYAASVWRTKNAEHGGERGEFSRVRPCCLKMLY